MKLKNLYLITLVAGLFFSCATEEVIDNPTLPQGEDVILNLTIAPEDVTVTRSAYYVSDNKVYYPATKEEKQINSCLLVVFADNKVYWSKEYTAAELGSPNLETVGDENRYIYTLPGVKAKFGEIRFLAIANPVADYSSVLVPGTLYSAFDKIEVNGGAGANTPVFESTELVKVGEKVATITENYQTGIQIPLTQLAARVDITFEFKPEGIDLAEYKPEISVETMNDNYDISFIDLSNEGRDVDLYVKDVEGNSYKVKAYYGNTSKSFEARSYYYYKKIGEGVYTKITDTKKLSNVKGITISEAYYKVVSSAKGWTVNVSNLIVHNIETESNVMLNYITPSKNEGNVLNEIKELMDRNITPTRIDNTHSYYFSFYTYERKYIENTANLDDMLHITFDATWEDGETITEQLVKRTLEGDDKMYLVAAEKDGTPVNGNCTHVSPIYLNDWTDLTDEEIANLDPVGNPSTKGTVNTRIESKYLIKINPKADPASSTAENTPKKFTDGVIHGNIYLYTATIGFPNVPNDYELEYEVLTWNNAEIDIPPFK